jgi:hypothetical protein
VSSSQPRRAAVGVLKPTHVERPKLAPFVHPLDPNALGIDGGSVSMLAVRFG